MLKLTDIKGVGNATVNKLNDLGIHTVFEVFSFLPKRYIDLKCPTSVLDVNVGELCLLEGCVENVGDVAKFGKRAFYITMKDELASKRAYFKVAFYNMPFLHDTFCVGQKYRLFARLTLDRGVPTVVNPQLEKIQKISKLDGIYTVYPLKNVMGQNAFKNIVYSALDSIKHADYSGNLGEVNRDIARCFYGAHHPCSLQQAEDSLETLASIDLAITLEIYRKLNKNGSKQRKVFYNLDKNRILDAVDNYKKAIGFAPTPSQELAFEEIARDMMSSQNMSRVISGDVGSGKTVVAFFAMILTAIGGVQSALMVPTEILAKQHSAKFAKIAECFGIRFATLTGSLSQRERKEVLQGLKNGDVQCVIGTNALVSEDVEYNNLSLAIIDEQHRFGVNDRAELEKKGAVDVLSMTATPIPRSMALTFYDDIMISRIEKRADAKTNVTTQVVSDLNGTLHKVVDLAKRGEQAFIICPSIVDAEGNDIMSIESFVKDYSSYFDNLNVSIMHGKLSNEEKNEVMNDFAEHRTDVLIATTVVEVGIDTDATQILVLNADRFGLASLHQLRGRVGRRGDPSYCYLHTESTTDKAVERLSALCKSNDGQYLAEIDFKMRGAGEFIGTKQSGRSLTPMFDLQMSAYVLQKAKEYADAKLKPLKLNELLALTRQSRAKVDAFIDKLRSVTLNS